MTGNFATITDGRLSIVDGFFLKRSVNINEIVNISYSPQFIGGMGAKMLTVYSRKDNQLKALNIGSNHFSSQQTLANIVHEIVQQNLLIQLDEPVRKLVNKYPRQPAPATKS